MLSTLFVAFVGGVVVMGLVARIMKIPAGQSANVIIGAVLLSVLPPLLLESL